MRLLSVRGHHIWTVPLQKDSVVVDAGAHRGEFSAEIIRRFGSSCHLVEPNPALVADLSISKAASITPAALSAQDGRACLHLADNMESSSLSSTGTNSKEITTVEVETVTLTNLMKQLGLERIDLLKLDIEGEEFGVLATVSDAVLRRINQLTVEFHDFQPRFRGRKLFETARERLESLGFVCAVMSFRTHGDVLFLNRGALEISSQAGFYLRFVARFVEKTRSCLGRSIIR
jgi:FkbM family methyltransferase